MGGWGRVVMVCKFLEQKFLWTLVVFVKASVTVYVRDVAVYVSIMCVQILISWSHQITVYRLQ